MLKREKTSNNYCPAGSSFFKSNLTTIISANKDVIGVVGQQMLRLKLERGLTYPQIAAKVGCCDMTLWKIVKGRLDYCSITLLSAIACSFGYSLLEWLREPVPDDVRAEVEKAAGVFGK